MEGWPRKLEILGELKQSVPVFCCFCLFGFFAQVSCRLAFFFFPFSDGLIYMRVVLLQFLVAACNKIIEDVDINDITSVRSHVFRIASSFHRSEETKRGRTNIKSKGLFHRSAHLDSLLLFFFTVPAGQRGLNSPSDSSVLPNGYSCSNPYGLCRLATFLFILQDFVCL